MEDKHEQPWPPAETLPSAPPAATQAAAPPSVPPYAAPHHSAPLSYAAPPPATPYAAPPPATPYAAQHSAQPPYAAQHSATLLGWTNPFVEASLPPVPPAFAAPPLPPGPLSFSPLAIPPLPLWVAPFALAAGGAAWLLLFRVHNARANEVLVKTGLGLTRPVVTRTACLRLPYQEVQAVPLNLHELNVDTVVRTSEYQQLTVKTGVFVSVGETFDDAELFARRFPAGSDTNWRDVVSELLHGQFREFAANKGIQEVFDGRVPLVDSALSAIDHTMAGLGLKVHRLVIKDMEDVKGGTYFENRERKVAAEAKSAADAAVASAKAAAEKKTSEAAADAAEFVALQTQRTLVAEANTGVRRAEEAKRQAAAQNEAQQAVAQRLAELAATTAQLRAKEQTESLRAKDMAAATVNAETVVKKAMGDAEARERAASARLFEALRAADGVKAQGDADAAALLAKLNAQATGTAAIVASMGGNAEAAVRYLALADGTLVAIAKATADGVRGMEPKLNVWAANGGQVSDALQATAGSLPAFADAIKSTSGIDLASLMRTVAVAAPPQGKAQGELK